MYNPEDYNRGWGYNVAVQHYCQSAKVVALMDTDVLTGPNFVADVRDCHDKLKVVSPYLNIYYTDKDEVTNIKQSFDPTPLRNNNKIKNPVTISGGIVIWNKSAFLSIRGFEQYCGYSCEDRAMDVTILNHIPATQTRISPQTYIHLHHQPDGSARKNFKAIYNHLVTNYNCTVDKTLEPTDYIHKNCKHSDKSKTLDLLINRHSAFADQNLYKSRSSLTINGQYDENKILNTALNIFPPDFTACRLSA